MLSSGGPFWPCRAFWPCHLGIDNLNVVRSIGRLLDHGSFSSPLPLVKDGDLIAAVQHMIWLGAVRLSRLLRSKVMLLRMTLIKGGCVRRISGGNCEADTAADLGRRHQPEAVMDVRRTLLQVRTHWYPIIQELHRFTIAVSRVSVNHDGRGSTAPDPLVWDQGGRSKQRKVDIRFDIDLAPLPGPPGFLHGPWVMVRGGSVGDA